MNKIIITLILCLCLLPTTFAIVDYCGDGICTTTLSYQESNPTSVNYCPLDCGILTNEDWCHEEYNLINTNDYRYCLNTTCPACGSCGACEPCTISRIPASDLKTWASSNGYTTVVGNGISQPSVLNDYNWIIFLVLGFVIGYYYKRKKK